MLSVLLFVVPLAIGIPLAMYLIPSDNTKTTKPVTPHFDFITKSKDSVEIKLDIIIKHLNDLDIRLKKLEAVKVNKDTVDNTKVVNQKRQTKTEKSVTKKVKEKKQKPSPNKQK